MKRSDSDRRKSDALIKILEGEVMLLSDTVGEGIHWNRPNEIRAALCRIRHKAEQIAKALDVPMPEQD